jgi:hypothetical protein
VDQAVSQINFEPLSYSKVYLDTQYVKSVKGIGFANADYIISSLRQQMVAADCLLEDKKEDADFVVEVRVGALGKDSHDVTYGIPPSNSISNAASLVPNAPSIPAIPEISFARKSDEIGAAKIVAFAYHRETRQFVWQSGITPSKSTAKDTWVFGMGPIQSGTVRGKTQLAGERIPIPLGGISDRDKPPSERFAEMYGKQITDTATLKELNTADHGVRQANFEQSPPAPVTTPPATAKPPAAPTPPPSAPAKPTEKPTEPAKPPTTESAKKSS